MAREASAALANVLFLLETDNDETVHPELLVGATAIGWLRLLKRERINLPISILGG